MLEPLLRFTGTQRRHISRCDIFQRRRRRRLPPGCRRDCAGPKGRLALSASGAAGTLTRSLGTQPLCHCLHHPRRQWPHLETGPAVLPSPSPSRPSSACEVFSYQRVPSAGISQGFFRDSFSPWCLVQQTRRGPWSAAEDSDLLRLIEEHGPNNWVRLSQLLGTRTAKQCRERYHQNLKPSLNHTPITDEEGAMIEQLVAIHGKKWAEISRRLNGRSDNAVKNWWNGGASRRRRASLANRPAGLPAAGPTTQQPLAGPQVPHPQQQQQQQHLHHSPGITPSYGINNHHHINGHPQSDLGPSQYYSSSHQPPPLPPPQRQQRSSTSSPSSQQPPYSNSIPSQYPLPPPPSQHANQPPPSSSSSSQYPPSYQQAYDYPSQQNPPSQQLPPPPHASSSSTSSTSSSSSSSSSPSLFNPNYSISGQQRQNYEQSHQSSMAQDHHQYPQGPTSHLGPAPRISHHRVSMPNIHSSYQQQQQQPHAPHTPSPFSTNQGTSKSPYSQNDPTASPSRRSSSSGIVFNSAYTSDSSGFRKSSSVAMPSSTIDPHQSSPHGAASSAHNPISGPPLLGDPSAPSWASQNNSTSGQPPSFYPIVSSGPSPPNGGPRFPPQHTRSASVYQHPSSVRKRAMGLATSSPADELYSNTPYTRRFSATALSSANYNPSSRTSSIDSSMANSSDNEDPLSGSIHSLSKYSLTGNSSSRRNSHVVPLPPPEVSAPPSLITAPSSAGSSGSTSSTTSSLSSNSTASSSISTTPTHTMKHSNTFLPPVSLLSSNGKLPVSPPLGSSASNASSASSSAYSKSPPPPTFLTQPASSAMASIYPNGPMSSTTPGSPLGPNSYKGISSSSSSFKLASPFQHRHSISGYPPNQMTPNGVGLGLIEPKENGHQADLRLADMAGNSSNSTLLESTVSSDDPTTKNTPTLPSFSSSSPFDKASNNSANPNGTTSANSDGSESKLRFNEASYFDSLRKKSFRGLDSAPPSGHGASSRFDEDTEMTDANPRADLEDPRAMNGMDVVAAAAAASEKLPIISTTSHANATASGAPATIEEAEDKKLKIASLLS